MGVEPRTAGRSLLQGLLQANKVGEGGTGSADVQRPERTLSYSTVLTVSLSAAVPPQPRARAGVVSSGGTQQSAGNEWPE